MKFATALLAAALSAGTAHAACGPDQDPCQIDGGTYYIALPEAPSADTPVLVFLHGWGGAPKATLNNQRLVAPMLARGWAVIAPEGLRRDGTGPRSWNFYPGWGGRDETAFLTAVAQDAADRFGISDRDVMLSGFSAGGFMVSYLACASPESFAAYAPVAGGFWKPHPERCEGPIKLFQTHGWADTTVPLEGRSLGGGRFQQGDIFAGMEIWRAANACRDEKPTGFATTGPFLRRVWENCDPDSALEFALWPGGHTVPGGWADMAIDWFETVTAE